MLRGRDEVIGQLAVVDGVPFGVVNGRDGLLPQCTVDQRHLRLQLGDAVGIEQFDGREEPLKRTVG